MITGFNNENAIKMEVLDGSTNGTNVCVGSSHRYPLDIGYATGTLVGNKIMYICIVLNVCILFQTALSSSTFC